MLARSFKSHHSIMFATTELKFLHITCMVYQYVSTGHTYSYLQNLYVRRVNYLSVE